ncbi:MAG: hypothetical protein VKJ24_11955 [Synechococcales bacterium]|nr:hypothetical protein [Synechococcales bacterium]
MQQATFTSPTVPSAVATARANSLHPSIRKALHHLDSRLEDELARYRRHREGLSVQPSSVISLQAPTPQRSQQRRLDLATFAPVGHHAANVRQTNVTPTDKRGAAAELEFPSSNSEGSPSAQHSDPVSLRSGSLEAVSTSLPPEGFQSESIALQENLVESSDLDPSLSAPDDYLASSEALLRSLAEEEAREAATPDVVQHLMTPLGIGSMILMLVGSTMFGYLIMNPGSLGSIAEGIKQLASRATAPNASSSSDSSSPNDTTADNGLPAGSPVLGAQEFFDPSLDNLMALPDRGNLPLLSADKSTLSNPSALTSNPNQVVSGSKVPTNILGLSPSPSPLGNMTIGGSNPSSSSGSLGQSNPSSSTSSGLFGQNSERNISTSSIATLPTPSLRRPSTPSYSAPRYSAPSYRSGDSSNRPTSYYNPEPPATTPLPPAPQILPTSLPTVNVPPPVAPSQSAGFPNASDRSTAASESPSSSGSNYKVVVPYDNDRTLDQIQQIDSGAYFKNSESGAVIQTSGSYSSEAEAAAKVQELKQQGIPAEVQK